MKTKLIFLLTLFACVLYISRISAQDMRQTTQKLQEKREKALNKAVLEKEIAEKEATESLAKILKDKNSLLKAIKNLDLRNRAVDNENRKLEKKNRALAKKEEKLSLQEGDLDTMVKELTGLVRVTAKNLDSFLVQSPQSAIFTKRDEKIKPILNKSRFPGMDDIRLIAETLFDEMKHSGEVRLQDSVIVERSGEEVTAKVLSIGNFTAAYELGNETGFLNYSPKSMRLFALSKLPGRGISKKIENYMSGKSDEAPVDLSGGAALRQLSHRISLKDKIRSGGPIVWPILGIGFIALIIIIERFIFLNKVRLNASKLMNKVNKLAIEGKWKECMALCKRQEGRPIPNVLLAGIKNRHMNREGMENMLQETILGEIPRLEKFLPTLGVLAAIAPLLGLLGTVTGMINTFHVITLYGTGDPRMMSGGISEALVTTMLGLSMAIPIMLFHTFLSRISENIISEMEEKAVALTNIVFKEKGGG